MAGTTATPVGRGVGIRGRILLAFLSLATLVGVTGGAGLWFVAGIGQSVTILADVALPLLQQSQSLADNAEAVQSKSREAIALADPSRHRGELAELTRQGKADLARLR